MMSSASRDSSSNFDSSPESSDSWSDIPHPSSRGRGVVGYVVIFVGVSAFLGGSPPFLFPLASTLRASSRTEPTSISSIVSGFKSVGGSTSVTNGRKSFSPLLDMIFGRSDAAGGTAQCFEGVPTPAPVLVLGLGVGLALVPTPSRKERNRDAKSVSGVERVLGMERLGLYDFQLRRPAILAALHTHPYLTRCLTSLMHLSG
jgi:hypothetical protein